MRDDTCGSPDACPHMTDNPERVSIFKWCSIENRPTAPAFQACELKEVPSVNTDRPDDSPAAGRS